MNGREIVASFPLDRRSHCLEASKSLRVMDALFEEVELRFANAHLPIHLEEAFTSFVKGIVADGFELQVSRVAA